MIVPDVNLLVHAYNASSPVHTKAARWWVSVMNGSRSVGLAWVVILGFVRITTHTAILANPIAVGKAREHVMKWLQQPQVGLLHPGSRHAELLFGLLDTLGTAGNLTTDAHLAALAIEHQAEVFTTDADFSRFPGLSWRNPLR